MLFEPRQSIRMWGPGHHSPFMAVYLNYRAECRVSLCKFIAQTYYRWIMAPYRLTSSESASWVTPARHRPARAALVTVLWAELSDSPSLSSFSPLKEKR